MNDFRSQSPQVLVVDDESSNLDALERILNRDGLNTLRATNGAEALKQLEVSPVSLVVTDLKMPGMDGFALLREVKRTRPEIEVIVITAHAAIEAAVAAVKEGAYDFVAKPFERITILGTVRKALEKQQLRRENLQLKAALASVGGGGELIGNSPAMRRLGELIGQAANSDATVLILGESGTGKELVAKALHERSKRAQGPFVKVSCTTLPEGLLEAELFGYEKGAFTGAIARREGRFEIADKGTIFLDEIGDLPLPVQGKLLRVLQDGSFERLGSNKTLNVDVRVVAATHRPLKDEVANKRFREDLYYRLNVIQIDLPPLRLRGGDIPLLANHFLRIYAAKNQKQIYGFDDAAMRFLENYPWPGNVRELENTIERAVVLTTGSILSGADLQKMNWNTAVGDSDPSSMNELRIPVGTPLVEVERQMIEATLRLTAGNKEKAASLLGIAARTIYRKM